MIRPLKWIGDLLFQNLLWKLLSLTIAVVIWALVATEPELATFASVRLEYKNLPEGLEISSDPLGSVVLELRGPSGALRGMGDTVRPAVIIDMSDAASGERTFGIGERNVKVMRGIRLVRAIPSQVRFRFEPAMTKSVSVSPRFIGEDKGDYAVAAYQVNPRNLEITGPASRVSRISMVVADPIDVSSTSTAARFHVSVFAEDSFVRFTDSPEVVVAVTMKKK